MEFNLFNKTELVFKNILLQGVNLQEIAIAVSSVLEIDPSKVIVIDASANHIALDILEHTIKAENILQFKEKILAEIDNIKGLTALENIEFCSQGILGAVNLPVENLQDYFESAKNISAEIKKKIAKRCLIFATGNEIKRGYIQDTNTTFLENKITAQGYQVQRGGSLNDDETLIAGKLRQGLNNGFGLIITTGGTGAETKDQTIEALLKVDETAATPAILSFQKGQGRHHKSQVRIGVGEVGNSVIVCLPGPQDEVELVIDDLLNNLSRLSKAELALQMATKLRQKFKGKS